MKILKEGLYYILFLIIITSWFIIPFLIMLVPCIITGNSWWLFTSIIAIPLAMMLVNRVNAMLDFIEPLNPTR